MVQQIIVCDWVEDMQQRKDVDVNQFFQKVTNVTYLGTYMRETAKVV